MKIVTRQEAGKVRVGESLLITILQISDGRIKLGFASERPSWREDSAADKLLQIHCNRRAYYRFSAEGRLLIMELSQGEKVTLNGSEEVVVLEVRRAGVTLAICSECEHVLIRQRRYS